MDEDSFAVEIPLRLKLRGEGPAGKLKPPLRNVENSPSQPRLLNNQPTPAPHFLTTQ
jgi:hypothetical protein